MLSVENAVDASLMVGEAGEAEGWTFIIIIISVRRENVTQSGKMENK